MPVAVELPLRRPGAGAQRQHDKLNLSARRIDQHVLELVRSSPVGPSNCIYQFAEARRLAGLS